MNGSIRTARHRALLLVLLGAACTHDEPFTPPDDFNTLVPFADTEPARLTWSEFADLAPEWLPDGEGLVYSFHNAETPEGDRCLGILPRTGGQRLRELCRRTLADRDSIDVLDLPAVSAGGRLAYLTSTSTLSGIFPEHTELASGTLDDPFGGPVLRRIPFSTPDGAFYTSISQPRWVGETDLVFIGRVQEFDRGVVHLVADGSGTAAMLPGTESATSVAVDTDGSILITRAGDTRIYRRNLASGEETIAHDVTAWVPTSLGASGGRIVARIAGGLYVAHLASGTSTELAGADLTRPAVHPDGTLVVGEILHPENFDLDLWRLTIP